MKSKHERRFTMGMMLFILAVFCLGAIATIASRLSQDMSMSLPRAWVATVSAMGVLAGVMYGLGWLEERHRNRGESQ